MEGTLSQLRDFFRAEREGLRTLAFHRNRWEALEPGLRRVYRAGRRALRASDRDGTEANLHEWRKQAKTLWHQLQLLELSWRPHDGALGEKLHALVDALGEDHDLAGLRRRLEAEVRSFGGKRRLGPFLARIEKQRRGFQGQALHLGEELYAARPRAFSRRMEGYWKIARESPASRRGVPFPEAPEGRASPRRAPGPPRENIVTL